MWMMMMTIIIVFLNQLSFSLGNKIGSLEILFLSTYVSQDDFSSFSYFNIVRIERFPVRAAILISHVPKRRRGLQRWAKGGEKKTVPCPFSRFDPHPRKANQALDLDDLTENVALWTQSRRYQTVSISLLFVYYITTFFIVTVTYHKLSVNIHHL